jgi:endonuclease YncB( thermonuclease family)
VVSLLAVAMLLLSLLPGGRASEDPLAAKAEGLTGLATVVDGDGLEIAGVKIRLFGIDAPEIDQYCRRDDGTRWRCGQYATVALDRLAGGHEVRCESKDEDAYGRVVAVCRLGPLDLGSELVASGSAVAYRRYSNDYVDEEERAKRERAGVWRGRFEMPWDWRKRMRDTGGRLLP